MLEAAVAGLDYTIFAGKYLTDFRPSPWKQPPCTVVWPSGLRRWIKAPVSQEAWVQIPPLPVTRLFFTVQVPMNDIFC